MKLISVCNYCGSPRVFRDALAAINTDVVHTYDNTYCEDCAGECSVTEEAVVDAFDLATNFYKFVEVAK